MVGAVDLDNNWIIRLIPRKDDPIENPKTGSWAIQKSNQLNGGTRAEGTHHGFNIWSSRITEGKKKAGQDPARL